MSSAPMRTAAAGVVDGGTGGADVGEHGVVIVDIGGGRQFFEDEVAEGGGAAEAAGEFGAFEDEVLIGRGGKIVGADHGGRAGVGAAEGDGSAAVGAALAEIDHDAGVFGEGVAGVRGRG